MTVNGEHKRRMNSTPETENVTRSQRTDCSYSDETVNEPPRSAREDTPLRSMQRTQGNRAVSRLVSTVRRARQERRIHESGSESSVDRHAAPSRSEVRERSPPGESPPVVRPGTERETTASSEERTADSLAPAVVHEVLQSPGQPLRAPVRSFFESRFGRDFGDVRVHADAKAAQSAKEIDAIAYTVGNQIVLGSEQPPLDSTVGVWLLAHELTHVSQQSGANVEGSRLEIGESSDRLERQAADVAEKVIDGNSIGGIQLQRTVPVVQRQCPPLPGYRRLRGRVMRRPSIWKPANDAIERAYLEARGSAGVLTGSQFEQGGRGGGRGTLLPRGAPNRRVANRFLASFRGVSRQLSPDIIDFTRNEIYEIKGSSPQSIVQGIAQIKGYYRLAGELQAEYGGPSWNQDLASWRPPILLPFPGNPNRKICAYRGPVDGLILYEVHQRTRRRRQRPQRRPQQQPRSTPQRPRQPTIRPRPPVVGRPPPSVARSLLWRRFWRAVARRFAVRAGTAAALALADGPLPVGDLLSLGLTIWTVYEIIELWDELWEEAEREAQAETEEPLPEIPIPPLPRGSERIEDLVARGEGSPSNGTEIG